MNVLYSRKSLLFNYEETWIKKNGGQFDVTMGAYDGTEVCELVGIFLLFQLSQDYKREDFGLYRDDVLVIFKNKRGQQMEKIKKHFVKMFESNDFLISIQCIMKIVNYLDVTFDLNGNSFRQYSKCDNELSYVNCDSNHPPSVIKILPRTVELRLSATSSNELIFKSDTSSYEEALKKAGY